MTEKLDRDGLIQYSEPAKEDIPKALDQIKKVHDPSYVDEVEFLCKRGSRILSPFDSDTYVSKDSFDVCILAQAAWLEAVDISLEKKSMAFALTRPPGTLYVRNIPSINPI